MNRPLYGRIGAGSTILDKVTNAAGMALRGYRALSSAAEGIQYGRDAAGEIRTAVSSLSSAREAASSALESASSALASARQVSSAIRISGPTGDPGPPLVLSPAQQGEFAFWGNQATEHMLFMHLGLEDPVLKQQALDLYTQMKAAYDRRDVAAFLPLLDQAMTMKHRVLTRLLAGEWLGWIFPTFVDHTLREESYFLSKLQGSVPQTAETMAWLRFMAEHAEFASHLVDTTERAAMLHALTLASDLNGLESACTQSCGAQLAALSAQKGRELDQFFSSMTPTKPLSVIHPVLAAHVVREGRRFVDTMDRLSGVSQASPLYHAL